MEFAKKIRSHQLSELRQSSGTQKTIEVVLPCFVCVLFARYRDFGGVRQLKDLMRNVRKRYDAELSDWAREHVEGGTIFDKFILERPGSAKPKLDENGNPIEGSENLFSHASLVDDMCLKVLRDPETGKD